MTQFEKDTLLKLLFMYENELKENKVTINGKAIDEKWIKDGIEKLNTIESLVSCMD